MSKELGFIMEKQIRHLAALFYQSDCRKFLPDLDFKNSCHPEEIGCWNKAIIAYSVLNNDEGLLNHQAKPRSIFDC